MLGCLASKNNQSKIYFEFLDYPMDFMYYIGVYYFKEKEQKGLRFRVWELKNKKDYHGDCR